MKKFIKIVMVIILLVSFNAKSQVTINPDDPGNATNPIDRKNVTAKDFLWMGELHNKVLDDFYKNSNEDFKDLDLLSEYITNQLGIYQKHEGYELTYNYTKEYLSKESYSRPFTQYIKVNINPTIQNYFLEYENIIYSKSLNLQQKINNIINLENEVEASGMPKEWKLVFFTGTSIGKSSISYWYDNYTKWERDSHFSNNKVANSSGPILDIIGADIAGGIGAAVVAWIINVVPGWGQIGYGAAIVGGAVGSSVTTAVTHLWDWIWE